MAAGKLGFAIDRGGTFTDVFVSRADGITRVLKLLSEDPGNYSDAPTEAIRRVLEEEFGKPIPRSTPIDTSNISWIRMGTTVATNALLERKGERIALVITKGFANLLDIGNQSRPKIFDLKIQMPSVLYDRIVEVDERVVLGQSDCELEDSSERVTATTGDELRVWQKVNIDKLRSDLQNTFNEGIRSLAVILLHSYMYPQHELEMGRLASEIGFTNISLSSQIMPMIKAVPRGFTACADAYLTPVINTYVDSFCSGFRDNLMGVPVLFMQSDGGLCPVHKFYGSRAILSGPAGGVVGISVTSFNPKTKQPVIGFDMGGTSTDVSRYAGEFSHVFETTTAGVTIQAPQLDINTVAAGGGSRLFFRSGLFVVGPESAGANPGPVCYRKGGYLTITDANLILGRIIPDFFPKIFGPNEDEPLDEGATLKVFQQLTKEANEFIQSSSASKQPMSVQEVALGFIDVANEAMCRPIRNLTQAKGYDTAQHILSCFGGAGGQHACAIAKVLGMKSVFVHKYSGILSAYGLALADVVAEAQEPCHMPYVKDNFALFDSKLKELIAKCRSDLVQQGFNEHQISVETFLNMRYDRTDCAIMCHPITPQSSELGDFLTSFQESYQREFGFVIKDRQIIVDDIRVRGVAQIGIRETLKVSKSVGPLIPHSTRKCYFKGGFRETKLHLWSELQAGHCVVGPAIIIEKNSTVLVEPDCTATVTDEGDLMIEVASESQKGIEKSQKGIDTKVDPIQLSIFSHRFMSIAEQMGRILQRTSISTNIKERLDFSCALFGPDGGLIANAPHIPVHLGSMQETVRFQLQLLGDKISDGDVYLSNHPIAGGSHLPDLTVITPVFYRNSIHPVFFVAARGHHADIGGLVPGSMPPHSTSLADEGATFVSLKLVDKGRFMEEDVTEALMAPGKIPGCSGTRNLSDNLSDLRAQIAANRKGMILVCELIDAYGLDVVQAYMAHIQANAEVAVRDLLKEVATETQKVTGTCKLTAVDHMDDGTPIRLSVDIDQLQGEATFDFSGTGWEVWGNCNTPRAVVYAAVIYCLRCLVGHDIPLNQGCLNPVKVLIPANSILSPSPQAAVVGGNVLTSQRLVDVIFKAFQSCAASQGCMNNITFGNDRLGYYETVAGGAGAGPTWHGVSGVHTHMTNTRITDVEILERRYPIILRHFGLRSNSGGRGQFSGGNGVIRAYLFRTSLTLSVLTERRVFAPYGLHGGQPGSKGLNVMRFADGRVVNLGSKKSIQVHPGDLFILQTPGGGGWGKVDETSAEEPEVYNEALRMGICHKWVNFSSKTTNIRFHSVQMSFQVVVDHF